MTDNTDYMQMLHRMLRAAGRRVAYGDVEDLAQLLELSQVLDDVIASTISELRDHQGFSWAWIAEATRTTRQGAQQRWGRRIGRKRADAPDLPMASDLYRKANG